MPLTQGRATVREVVPLLMVEGIQRSVAFYEQLGFELMQKWEPQGNLAWCRLQRDDSALMLQQATDEDGPAAGRGYGVGFYFICDDAAALHDELRSRGVPVDPPTAAFYGMNQIFLKDPDGYELCFESASE
jgi:glyoxylase I family protein